MEDTSSAKSKCADLYEGIKQAEARREELRSQLPFFTPPGLFSSAVQSVCGLIDHGGHCYQVEGLLARSQFLEAELDRHAKMLEVRSRLATPEYYHENMKLAREAKNDAVRRAEELRERIYRLNQEYAEAVRLPIAQEKELDKLKAELEGVTRALEEEKKQRAAAVDSYKKTVEQLKVVCVQLDKGREKLKAQQAKLRHNADLFDQLSSEKCRIKEENEQMGQELELTRASAQEATKRYSKLKDDIGSYYRDWEKCHARVLEDQQRSITSMHSELSTANAAINDKDRELQAIKIEVQDRESRLSTLQASLDAVESSTAHLKLTVTEKDAEIERLSEKLVVADRDLAALEAGIHEAKRCNIEADATIDHLRKDFKSKEEEVRNLRFALAPRVSQEMALYKLQGHVSDLRRALKDKNLCIEDLKSQIKTIKATSASLSDDRLKVLRESNRQLEQEASDLKDQRSSALSTVNNLITDAEQAKLIQSNMQSKIELLEASLRSRNSRIADLTNQLTESSQKAIDLEERVNELEARDVAACEKEQLAYDKMKQQEVFVYRLSCKVISQTWEKGELQQALQKTEASYIKTSIEVENLQQANAQLVSELHISKDQLSNSQADVATLNDLNRTLDDQKQALTVELLTQRGELHHVEAQAKSDIARLTTEVERLHGRNRQWISRLLTLDEGKQKVMDGLRLARDTTASRLEQVKQELSTALDKVQDLELLATQKEARIMELTGQLARTTNASSPTAQKSNDVSVRKNTNKTQDNSVPFVKDFDRRRMFFENAQRAASTAAHSQAVTSSTIRVRPMVKRLEDGLSPIPIETEQDTKVVTRLRIPLEGSPLRRSPGMRLTTLFDPVGTREEEQRDGQTLEELVEAQDGGFVAPPGKMVFDSVYTQVAKDEDEGSQAGRTEGVGEVDETDAELLGYDMVDDGYQAVPSDSTPSSSTAPSFHQRHKSKGSVKGTLKRVGGLKKKLSGGIALSILPGSTPSASASASVDAHRDSQDHAKRFFSKLKKRLGGL